MKIFGRIIGVLGIVLSAGCAGYRLGSMLPPGVRRIHVPVAENKTDEPLIENEITRAVVAEIQRNGSLKIAAAGEADAELRLTIKHFSLSPVAFRADARSEPDEYRLRLEAGFVLVRAGSDVVIAEQPFSLGEATVRLQGDFSAAKQTALPVAARELARDIVRRLVEYW